LEELIEAEGGLGTGKKGRKGKPRSGKGGGGGELKNLAGPYRGEGKGKLRLKKSYPREVKV